jgi:hypothetical protein
MEIIFSEINSMTFVQIGITSIVVILMWMPFFRKLKYWMRLLFLIFMFVPGALAAGLLGASICALSYFILIVTMLLKNRIYIYSCEKCRFQKEFEQSLGLYKCPQCDHENIT